MFVRLKKDIRASDKRIVSIIILIVYRSGNFIYYSNLNKIIKNILLLFLKIINKIIVDIILGVYLPFRCQIGEGLRLLHPKGIVINDSAIIGTNCIIYHGVTIGVSGLPNDISAPTIGNNCLLGAGSKIIGGISIGNNVRIGANAVATKDIPNGSTVICTQQIILKNKEKYCIIS